MALSQIPLLTSPLAKEATITKNIFVRKTVAGVFIFSSSDPKTLGHNKLAQSQGAFNSAFGIKNIDPPANMLCL